MAGPFYLSLLLPFPTLRDVQSYFRRTLLGVCIGLIAGCSSTLFLFLLQAVTNFRDENTRIVFFLPLAGLLLGAFFHYFGPGLGIHPILKATQDGRSPISWKSAPFVLIGTLVTHLFGGSAGREGTAVQMSSSLSDWSVSKIFALSVDERKVLLQAGIGAGFGSAIGAPMAGFFFGLEILKFRRLHSLWECFVASFLAYQISQWLHAPHSYFPKLGPLGWPEGKMLLAALALAMAAGLFARIYLWLVESIEQGIHKLFPPIRTLLGGSLLTIGFYFFGVRYMGLGISYIQESFLVASPFFDPALKTLFTAVTIGTGFKGGEFIPLIFVGTTLGSALSVWIPGSLPLLPALGFPAVFSAASKTPIACTVMAMEIFGPLVGLYALPICFLATWVSGKKTTYPLD